MATIQGDFANNQEARAAKAALIQTGVIDSRIRIWNILPESGPVRSGGNAVPTGAAIGGLVGGAGGLVAGAGIGAVIDGGEADTGRLPGPSGVRVVVDIENDEDDLAHVLRDCGATNVRPGVRGAH